MKEKDAENLKKIREKRDKGEKLNFKERNILNIVDKRAKISSKKLEYGKNVRKYSKNIRTKN